MRLSQLAVWATLLFLHTNGWATTWFIVSGRDGAVGSLRDVINNRAASGDTISLTRFAGQTLELSRGELVLNKNLTITGGIGDPVTIKQTAKARVFDVVNGATVTLQNLVISGGVESSGGGISVENSSTLTLNHSTVSGNMATSSSNAHGGGIYVDGSNLNVQNSEIKDNTSDSRSEALGGGIYVGQGSTLTVGNSTISANSASASNALGGGVYANVSSSTTLTNCTISNNSTTSTSNSSPPTVSAIFATGEGVILNNCTIIANRSIGTAGFALQVPRSSVVKNSLVIGNTRNGRGSDVNGDFGVGSGYNQIGLTVDGVAHTLGDFVETETIDGVVVPKLADNGGPTRTIALAPRSPALDAGDPNFDSTTLPYDQRGAEYARVERRRIDIGAFEHVNLPPTLSSCLSLAVYQVESTDQCTVVPDFTSFASDPEGDVITFTVTPSQLTLGRTTLELMAADGFGATAGCPALPVEVRDVTPPQITCPVPTTIEATSPLGATASLTPTAHDVCDTAPELHCDLSESPLSLGEHKIACTSKDKSGNSSSCEAIVRIVDTAAPVLTCPADVTVASGRDGAVLTPPLPTASDNVTGVTVLCDPATTQRLFPIGTTNFTCTAKDTAGNTSAPCTFHVTVFALASDLPLSTGGCDCDSSGRSNGARSEYGLFLGLAVLLFVLKKRVRS